MLNKLRPLKLIKIKVNKRCAKNINMCYNECERCYTYG